MRRAAMMQLVLGQLVLGLSACQSARKQPKTDSEVSRAREAQVEPIRDSVQSSVLEVRERTAASDRNTAGRTALTDSFTAEPPQEPAAPAATPPSPAASNGPRALGKADAMRFGRLKAAIERANAEIERHRPRSQQ